MYTGLNLLGSFLRAYFLANKRGCSAWTRRRFEGVGCHQIRSSGRRLSPVDLMEKMGVPDARDKAFDYAWLAIGNNVITSIWGKYIRAAENGRWFYLG